MHTFFHGWRRKAGIVALVMALILTGMWVRSSMMIDRITFTVAGVRFGFWSWDGAFLTVVLTVPEWFGWTWTASDTTDERGRYAASLSLKEFASLPILEGGRLAITSRFWVSVLLLTLLSAYLILWKPRKRPSPN